MIRMATLSDCGRYRYHLRRDLSDTPASNRTSLVFCMLNPSTADAEVDDPTIRRCIGFARREEVNDLVVLNLYAIRSTDPAGIHRSGSIGPENNTWLEAYSGPWQRIVCAWGALAPAERVREVVALFRKGGATLYHLGLTKSGQPRHPLYVRADQPLEVWKP